MQNFKKETMKILKEEGLTPEKMQFIFDEIACVNKKARIIKNNGACWENLNPYILKQILNEYNKRNDIDFKTGEIINKDIKTNDLIKEEE